VANFSQFDDMKFDGAQEEATLKGVVDIIFLLDVTGSMGPAIVELGKNMINFINSIDSNMVSDYKVKIVSFGDFDSDSDDIKFNINRAYTDDPQQLYNDFLDVIELVKKKGGGADLPESALDALYKTIQDGFQSDWSERTRVVVLFTDAISKELRKDTIGMDLSAEDKLQMMAQLLNDNRVRTYIYSPNDDSMVKLTQLCSEYVVYNAIDENGSNPIEALRKLDFKEEMKSLGKVVSQPSLVM